MSDDEEFEDAYRAYEDELYKDRTSDDSDSDCEIEESLYAQVHHSSSLTLSSGKPTKRETAPPSYALRLSSNVESGLGTPSAEPKKDIPLIVLDSTESEEFIQSSDHDDNDSSDNDRDNDGDGVETPSFKYPVVCISEEDWSNEKKARDETQARGDTSSDEVRVIEENWNLSVNDLIDGPKGKRRYYGNYGGRCHNCNERGHLSRDCAEPKRQHACFLCGDQNHERRVCPNELCFNCNKPGHKSKQCREPFKRRWANNCQRCYLNGHIEKDCPDDWRRYHLTTTHGPVVEQPRDCKKQKNIFCFNCAKKGHFGHECTKEKMHREKVITLPFIVNYGSCRNHKRCHTSVEDYHGRRKEHRKEHQRRHSDPSWTEDKRMHHHNHRRIAHEHSSGKRQYCTETASKGKQVSLNNPTSQVRDNLSKNNKKRKQRHKEHHMVIQMNQDRRIVTLDGETPPKKKRRKSRGKNKKLPDLRFELNNLMQNSPTDLNKGLPDLRLTLTHPGQQESSRGFQFVHREMTGVNTA